MTEGATETTMRTVAIRWDPAAETFMRLTLDPCGRILARRDLEPVEKAAALRCLFLTHTTTAQRRAVGGLLDRAGLLLRPQPAGRQGDPTALSRRFLAGGATPDIVAWAERLDVEARAILVLAWALALVRVVPGQALPRLEDLDADLPYMPPEGPAPGPDPIDLDAILEEAVAASALVSIDFP
ncbi:hypothetical protein [Methylobacterium gregans]|uniref:Uncharacterized protein n=1 Tax=Methylobacterium gregans TaxID=374424 RepID=A0AA37MB45_9HYPH|nr:hypothetical protein [Methylobacterium gregans]MDQ0520302.1 hypothetical protein [Methylobacterium gregans]GJD78509.1 hypothetical protein NBEOAGPD_1725 [Methylobacterium gregans]GLS52705.1 hypothetical protein GCM10007886_08880 [Methylobacterium gregans]